jgi:hypothetical protein
MKNKRRVRIVASCRTPGIGLGNRLTILCSAYASSVMRGVPCALYWPKGFGCQAEWKDLFKPLECVEMVKSPPSAMEEHRQCSYTGGRIRKHVTMAGLEKFTPEYWAAWRECARLITLIDDLALPDAPPGFTAVSIRANWAPRAPRQDWDHRLVLPRGSFICTDSPAALERALAICEDGWHLSQPVSSHDMGARDLASVQAAARDLMMLTRASLILAVGERSTFRNLAHIGYQVPLFAYYRGRNP